MSLSLIHAQRVSFLKITIQKKVPATISIIKIISTTQGDSNGSFKNGFASILSSYAMDSIRSALKQRKIPCSNPDYGTITVI
jgi:hypothetical protein